MFETWIDEELFNVAKKGGAYPFLEFGIEECAIISIILLLP